MNLDLISSKIPTKQSLDRVFKNFGYDNYVMMTDHDWQNNASADVYIQTEPLIDKKWQCHLSIFCKDFFDDKISEKLLYFLMAKNIADINSCDVICCYFDNHIINSNTKNPYLDFAYIDKHWYLIDDINTAYANNRHHGDITIIRCIDQEMNYFLTHGIYWYTLTPNNHPNHPINSNKVKANKIITNQNLNIKPQDI